MYQTAHQPNHHISQALIEDHRYFQKIVHVLCGIFIWEYFTTIWFEWSFVTRKRPYRWSIWAYSGIRFVTLVNVLANLLQSDLDKSINCQAWLYFEYTTVYMAFTLGTLIMILKIRAVWHRNKGRQWAVAASIGAWLTNIAFFIRCIVTTSAHFEHTLGVCVLHNTRTTRDSVLATLCSEMFLILVMLAGLMRDREHYTGRLLFKQGLIWLFVANCAQVPLIVLFSLNRRGVSLIITSALLNRLAKGPTNFSGLSKVLSMAIGMTRLYRGLTMANDPPSALKSRHIIAMGPGRVSIVFASYYPSNHSSMQMQTVERSIVIPLPDLEQAGANEDIPRPVPKSAPSTVTLFRGHGSV